MNKKSFASTIIAVILVCPVLAVTHTFTPTDIDSLKVKMSDGSLQPGDTLLLQDGTYSHLGKVSFTGNGTTDYPIILKAANTGKAIISGTTEIRMSGSYLQLEGLYFHKAWASDFEMIEFQLDKEHPATHCRITRCAIDDCNDPAKGEKPGGGTENWIGLHGNNNRIDHCYFANKRARGLVIQITVEDGGDHNHHQIDHNVFGYRKPFGGNGAEIIRVGNSWSSQLPSYSIIEENIFYHCDGENEIISVKSGFNIVRRNLFYESRGGLVCRHGHNNIIDSNVIIGNHLPATLGIRIINQGHTVSNNYVESVTGKGSGAAFILRMGVYERPNTSEDYEDEKLKSYHRAADIDIACNTFVDCTELNFGDGRGDKEPRNVRFAHNRIYSPNTVPNIKISNPTIFPGITFINNFCQFKNNESPNIKGFQITTFNIEQIKAQRHQAVSPMDCGTSWHNVELSEMKTLTELMN